MELTTTTLESVFERIAEGESLRKISDSLGIANSVLWGEVTSEAYQEQYSRAIRQRADFYADKIVDLALQDPRETPMGTVDGGDVNHRRLAIDALKWTACKLFPRKYGDKLDVAHQGNVTLTVDTGVPLRVVTAEPRALPPPEPVAYPDELAELEDQDQQP
jgi:hypothetical protein